MKSLRESFVEGINEKKKELNIMFHGNSRYICCFIGIFVGLTTFCNAEQDIPDRRAEFFEAFPSIDIHYDDLDLEMANDCLKAREYASFTRDFKRAIDFSIEREFYKNDALLAIALPDDFGEEIECDLQEWFGVNRLNDETYNQAFYRDLFSITGECGGEINEIYAALDPVVQKMSEAKLWWYKEEAKKRINSAGCKVKYIKNNINREKVQDLVDKAMMAMFDAIKNGKKMEYATLQLENDIRVVLGNTVCFHNPLLDDVKWAHHWNVRYDRLRHTLTGK